MNFQILLECQGQFLKVNIIKLINKSLDFVKLTSKSSINLIDRTKDKFINCDEDQLNRVIVNLIKNSESHFWDRLQKSLILKEILT